MSLTRQEQERYQELRRTVDAGPRGTLAYARAVGELGRLQQAADRTRPTDAEKLELEKIAGEVS